MTSEAEYEFETIRDVVYGNGLITKDGKQISRELWMDAYLPVGKEGVRPAVIVTHGGSFHIGSPRTAYSVDGVQTTSPEAYCRLLAGRGYACFAIQYRLGPETPIASGKGYTEDQIDRASMALMMDRASVIRENIGLRPLDTTDPADEKIISDTVLAAAEDLKAALDFIIGNAGKYQVDPERIVVGGFSAGAVTSMNVAHGMNAPVAGVFMLSSAPIGFKITETATGKSPPALLFIGQNDLSGAIIGAPVLVEHYKKVGLDLDFAWVPGFGHFYPSGAASLAADGTRMSVEERWPPPKKVVHVE